VIRRIDSNALLVRSVPYGESDLIATFFTEQIGKVSSIVRGARRSTKRFGGALEPLHELALSMEDKGKELCLLKEARIVRARTGMASNLEAMEAAGQALRWVRHLCPPRTPEPAAWASSTAILDALDEVAAAVAKDDLNPEEARRRTRQELAVFGLRLLTDMGYGFELDRCIRCGRACPEGRSAFVDAGGGGIVCTSCGGARRTISGDLRALYVGALRGQSIDLSWEQAGSLIDLAEEAMAAHADFDPHSVGRS
jgi:DNA repair protein RecO (recombination protein O)